MPLSMRDAATGVALRRHHEIVHSIFVFRGWCAGVFA
jgi:hypothetical protein